LKTEADGNSGDFKGISGNLTNLSAPDFLESAIAVPHVMTHVMSAHTGPRLPTAIASAAEVAIELPPEAIERLFELGRAAMQQSNAPAWLSPPGAGSTPT
jgi:hypothetical protein